MPLVILRPNWPSAVFRRTVPVKVDRKTKKVLESQTFVFDKTQATEVPGELMDHIKADLGNALFQVEFDPKGRIRYLDPSVPSLATEETQPQPAT